MIGINGLLGGESQIRTYRLTRANGTYIIVSNLSKYCRDNNQKIANYHAVSKGKRKTAYGFVKIEVINSEEPNS